MLKKFFGVMILATVLIFVGGQNNKAEAWRYQVVGISTYLSIRAEPDVYSREIARVPNGTILEPVFTYSSLKGYSVNLFTNGFANVYYRGMQCWAAQRYLQEIDW